MDFTVLIFSAYFMIQDIKMALNCLQKQFRFFIFIGILFIIITFSFVNRHKPALLIKEHNIQNEKVISNTFSKDSHSVFPYIHDRGTILQTTPKRNRINKTQSEFEADVELSFKALITPEAEFIQDINKNQEEGKNLADHQFKQLLQPPLIGLETPKRNRINKTGAKLETYVELPFGEGYTPDIIQNIDENQEKGNNLEDHKFKQLLQPSLIGFETPKRNIINKTEAEFEAYVELPFGAENPPEAVQDIDENEEEGTDFVAHQFRHFLQPSLIPNTFYYIWCGNKTFMFKQYLSILSVIRHMRPDNIVFYYDVFPNEHDREGTEEYHYNTWFVELQQYYPFLTAMHLTRAQNISACDPKSLKPKVPFILGLLKEHGGIYVSTEIMLTRILDLNQDYYFRWDALKNEGLLMAAPNVTTKLFYKDIIVNGRFEDPKCVNITLEYKYNRIGEDDFTTCIKILGKEFSFDLWSLGGKIYPKDFWTRTDSLGDSIRYVMYGTPKIQMPKKNEEMVVPNIGHMVWIGGGEMDFLFYLSVLSMLYIQKVEKLFIHGDLPPSGPLWDEVKYHPNIIYRYQNFDGMQVYGHKLGTRWAKLNAKLSWWIFAHWSDIKRVEILLKWGGIYIDTDAFLVRKLNNEFRKYDVVSHLSMASRPPYPDSFSNGFLMARPGAEFFKLFQKSMLQYEDSTWLYNGLLAPYKILERHSWVLKLESHLEVVCLKMLCHPTWVPEYKNMSIHHLNSNSIKDWRTDAYAYHFCSNHTPLEFKNETSLLNSSDDSIFTQMGKHVLKMAGRLK